MGQQARIKEIQNTTHNHHWIMCVCACVCFYDDITFNVYGCGDIKNFVRFISVDGISMRSSSSSSFKYVRVQFVVLSETKLYIFFLSFSPLEDS